MRACVGGCVSDHYDWLRRDVALSAARLKRRLGKGLSREDLIEQDLVLSPAQEKLVAGQVNVPSVCADMKVCVRAWVGVLVTIMTGCAGARPSVSFGSSAGSAHQ